MIAETEQRIRQRAHHIWENEGRPEGRDTVHWHIARAEVAAEISPARTKSAPARKAAAKPAAAKAATPKRFRTAGRAKASELA